MQPVKEALSNPCSKHLGCYIDVRVSKQRPLSSPLFSDAGPPHGSDGRLLHPFRFLALNGLGWSTRDSRRVAMKVLCEVRSLSSGFGAS